MLEEAQIKRIEKLREGGATIKEIAKAVEVGESTVQRYSSNNKTASNKNKNIINALNETWMGKLFWDGWEDDIELMQIFFNLNRLANKTGRDLDDFLEAIERTIAQYFRYSDTPLKLFDIFLDISSNITFLEDGYNMEEFTKVFESVYDNHVFIRDLEEEYNSIKEFKEQEKEKYDKLIKIATQIKGVNQNLSTIIVKAVNVIITKKAYYKKKRKKVKSAKTYNKKIKELKLENHILNQIISEFEQKFPLEVKQYIEEIKNQELQCKKTTNS